MYEPGWKHSLMAKSCLACVKDQDPFLASQKKQKKKKD
jgi:hypothetical protein